MPPEVEELDLSRSAFRVGEWLVQPSLNRVTRGDTTIQLELKVMDVLVCLAGRAGEVVSRRELTPPSGFGGPFDPRRSLRMTEVDGGAGVSPAHWDRAIRA